MNTKSIVSLLIVCISVFLFQCNRNPQIVFPEALLKGKVGGYIQPLHVNATAYLMDATIIDSTKADTVTGYFSFSDISYGTYLLKIVTDSFGIFKQTIELYRPVYSINASLKKYPSQIISISPQENDSISAYNNSNKNDSSFVITILFDTYMNKSSIEKHLSLIPPTPFSLELKNESKKDYLLISIPVIDFFKNQFFTLRLGKEITTAYFEPLDFDYTINYFPKTSVIDQVIEKYYLAGTVPYQTERNVKSDEDVIFTFKRSMDHASVEKSFHITPFIQPNFFWQESYPDSEKLIIKFSEPLQAATHYNISLDTFLMTTDSIHPPKPIVLSFQTEQLKFLTYSPNSTLYFHSLSKPFIYTTNLPVDSTSFVKAFSITPAVDSLNFSFSNNNKHIEITHSSLKEKTIYRISFDSTLITNTGIKYDDHLLQLFSTYLPDSIDNTNLIISKNDSTHLKSCDTEILLIFKTAMNRKSVEDRIILSPNVLFYPEWRNGDTLKIHPLQRLKSNTAYTVTIDSGYKTLDSRLTGIRHTLTVKTEPIRLLSFSPLSSQINVPLEKNVFFSFNTLIDTASIRSNLKFIPSVDSLIISATDSGYYYIDHKKFLPGTHYTMVLNDSITDLYGARIEKKYSIEFTTIK